MRKSIKRGVIIGAAVALLSGAGIAYAAWTATGTSTSP